MRNALITVVFFTLSFLGWAQSSAPSFTVTRWPGDRSAAISLTFDDGINTHLDYVGPILKKHNLHATFFVTTGMGPWEKRKSEWKALAEQGNELGNHTVHHPCMLPQITPHSQDYTPAMFEAEIRDAALELSKVVSAERGMTFAYPCGDMSFGKPGDEVKNSVLYLRYVSEHAFGARAVGAGSSNDPDDFNVLAINDVGPTAGKDFSALLEMAAPGIQGHNWGVYCFHGVGGDWLSITPEALDRLAAHLEQHTEIWAATFGDVLRYVQERKAAVVKVAQSDPNSLTVSMAWSLDKKIYDVPLTLKVKIPQTWKEASATGDGKTVTAKIVDQAQGHLVLIDVPAQTAEVRVTGR